MKRIGRIKKELASNKIRWVPHNRSGNGHDNLRGGMKMN